MKTLKAAIRISIVFLLVLAPLQAHGVYAVHDSANNFQLLIQVAKLKEQLDNQVLMIANQAKQISNDIKNLTALPFDVINDFTSELQGLFSAMGEVQGMMKEFSDVESYFLSNFPEFHKTEEFFTREQYLNQVDSWIDQNNEVLKGAGKTGAYVLATLPETEEQMRTLLEDSQAAVGALQAQQAANQLSGLVGSQLMKLNGLLANYIQVEITEKAVQNANAAMAQQERKKAYKKHEPSEVKPMTFNIFELEN